jgi:dephospho-CoA kinase
MARRIGLTGGIASGKSAAAAVLETLGAVVIDADAIAHEVTDPGGSVFEAVCRAFPSAARSGGELDRKELARLVFSDPEARERLNAIVHPAVRGRMNALAQAAEDKGAAAVVMEIPLLIENHLERHMDEVWLIEVSAKTQISRLMARSQLTEEQAKARIATQMPNAEKRAYAQVVIENEGTLEQLAERIRKTWKERGLTQ